MPNNGREWFRTAAPYIVALAGFAAAGVSLAAAYRVAPVEQRVAKLEARVDNVQSNIADIRSDIREIRDHMNRWDVARRQGRWFSADEDVVAPPLREQRSGPIHE